MSRLSEYNEADRAIIDPAAVLREKMNRSILREKKNRALAAWNEAVRLYRRTILSPSGRYSAEYTSAPWFKAASALGWDDVEGVASVGSGF